MSTGLPARDSFHNVAVRVLILLSTYNGEKFLRAQLDSLVAQTHTDWILYWRDDGSCDATVHVMQEFMAVEGAGRCVFIAEPLKRIGPAASFMALLRAVVPALLPSDGVAFMDQDDIWLPDKLARSLAALAPGSAGTPALYCGRVIVVDTNLRRLGITKIRSPAPGFPASLTQNIATGCTIMLNSNAVTLIAASRPPRAALHDWWCYLLITAAGGTVFVDERPTVLYRQHTGNTIGILPSPIRRAFAALRRGPKAFMFMLREHLTALSAQQELICPEARVIVRRLLRSVHGTIRERVVTIRTPGLRRRAGWETLVFRIWFLLGLPSDAERNRER